VIGMFLNTTLEGSDPVGQGSGSGRACSWVAAPPKGRALRGRRPTLAYGEGGALLFYLGPGHGRIATRLYDQDPESARTFELRTCSARS